MNYRIYVDSADERAVRELLAAGIIAGVTTNPTILKRSSQTGADIPRLYSAWHAAGAEEIFFQAWGVDREALLEQGRRLGDLGDDVVVKVPATRDGFLVAGELLAGGTPVLLTAVYSTAQAIAAASIGARYIAPYLGRLEDSGRDGQAEIGRMAAALMGTQTDVLAASVRSPAAIVSLAERGVRYFTAAPDVIWGLMDDPESISAAVVFESHMN